MRKNILFVRSIPVDPYPRIEKQAESIGSKNYDCKILAWDRTGKSSKQENKNDYEIHRFNFKAPFDSIFLSLYLPVWWLYVILYILRDRPNVIHATGFDSFLPALIGAKVINSKIIYDVNDFYPDTLDPLIPDFIKNILIMVDNYNIKVANGVVLANKLQKNQFDNFNRKVQNSAVINNTPSENLSNVSSLEIDNILNEDDFIIFYLGLIKNHRGFKQLLGAVKGLKDVRVIIAGYGGHTEKYLPLFEEQDNVEFIGKIPHQMGLNITTKSDLMFAFYDTSLSNNRYASPNKLFEAMKCGTPLLMNKGTYAASIVKREECGIVVEYDDVDEIRKKIIKLKNNPDVCEKLGINSREAYENKFSWEIMEKRLYSLYSRVIHGTDKENNF